MQGEIRVGKRLGWVAEFCSICRCIRPFELHEALVVQGNQVAEFKVVMCGECALMLPSDPSQYRASTPQRLEDLEDLIYRTQPGVRERWAGRLEVERRLLDGVPLDESVRLDLLREPFNLLGPALQNPPAPGITAGCLPLGLVALVSFIAAVFLKGTAMFVALTVACVAFLAALIPPVLVAFTPSHWRRRHLRKLGYPMLARSLGPLNPSAAELTEIVHGLQSVGVTGVAIIDPEELYEAVRGTRSRV